jgi:hypothetical protein
LKQQCDGAGEHLNYEKLRVAWKGLGKNAVYQEAYKFAKVTGNYDSMSL